MLRLHRFVPSLCDPQEPHLAHLNPPSSSSKQGIKTFFSPSKPSEDELTTKKEKKPTADIKVDVTVKDKDKELPSAETPATTVENKAVAAPVAASSSAKAAPAASAQKRAPVSKKKPKKGGKAQQQGDLRDHFVHVRSSSRVSAGVKKVRGWVRGVAKVHIVISKSTHQSYLHINATLQKQAEERITNMIRDGIEPGLKVRVCVRLSSLLNSSITNTFLIYMSICR